MNGAVSSISEARRLSLVDGDELGVVYGAEHVGRLAYDLQRGAREAVRVIVKPPYAVTIELDSLERDQLLRGVSFRVLYDHSALGVDNQLDTTKAMLALGEEAKVVAGAPTKMCLVDHEVALLPLTTGGGAAERAVVVRNPAMLAALERIFEELWRLAVPFTDRVPVEVRQPSEQDRWILSLLAAGATDASIGRILGLSSRTAHRRVRELMTRLGVQTRFQAGVQATRLGWL